MGSVIFIYTLSVSLYIICLRKSERTAVCLLFSQASGEKGWTFFVLSYYFSSTAVYARSNNQPSYENMKLRRKKEDGIRQRLQMPELKSIMRARKKTIFAMAVYISPLRSKCTMESFSRCV